MKKTEKRTLKGLIESLMESPGKHLKVGFASIKGGLTNLPAVNDHCNNDYSCNNTNYPGCTNSFNCFGSSNKGCTNSGQCFA